MKIGLAEHNNLLQLELRKWMSDEESPSVRSLEATSCAPFASTQPRPSLGDDLVTLAVLGRMLLEMLGAPYSQVKSTKLKKQMN